MNTQNPKTALYNLFGDANRPHAEKSLRERCFTRVPIERTHAARLTHSEDINFIRTHYSDQLAIHFAQHAIYESHGVACARMPLSDADYIHENLPQHHFSPTASAMNLTIRKLLQHRYDILIPLAPHSNFNGVVSCLNENFGFKHEPLQQITFAGKAYISCTREQFDTLTKNWMRDKSHPMSKALIEHLSAATPHDPRRFTDGYRVPPHRDGEIVAFDPARRTTPMRTVNEGEIVGQLVSGLFRQQG